MPVRIYSTCPQSKDVPAADYRHRVAEVARWSEEAGCTGILVYTDNGIVDPWLVSQTIIQSTTSLAPLVAVQPVYMHPYTAAKMVTSLGYMHGRSVHLNMLAGGFKNDLTALGDVTPHDDRYVRTVEYTQILMALLRGFAPLTLGGRYYKVANLKLAPRLDPALLPEVLMSGSSPAGLAAARAVGATAGKYPRPPGEEAQWVDDDGETFGVRIGVIARPTADEAWRVALERFPEDREGQITNKMAMAVSDSHWHRQLSRQTGAASPDPVTGEPDPYWLGPFQNYHTFCPYLVGSYDTVAAYVGHYIAVGSSTFILDIPPSAEELHHTGIVFDRAQQEVLA